MTRRRGSGLVMSLVCMAVFAILAAATYRLARAQTVESIFFMRSAQAQAIAEAGLEDALCNLRQSPAWNAGFNQKPFAGGFYTVTVGTGTPVTLLSRGYSAPIAIIGRAHRYAGGTVSFSGSNKALNPGFASLSQSIFKVDGFMDAYDSTIDLNPTTFGFGANIWSNAQVNVKDASGIKVRGSVVYQQGASPKPAAIEGSVALATYTYTLPFHDGSAYVNSNNNAAISPASVYNASKKLLTVGVGVTAAMAPGNYYLNGMTVDGTLQVNASSSAPVNIYLNGDATINGQVLNASGYPGALNFYGQSRITISLSNTVPIRAVIEARQAAISVNQVIYGRIVADNANISPTGVFHFDMEGRFSPVARAGFAPGSWYSGP
ncbi:MAG: hypothetical protein PHU21_02000 [Elusimicrobia bacterium]|nr:hypothetical protein [Elusimicrobiota bacterium]